MMVVHIASDVFMGVVAQTVTFWHAQVKVEFLDESIIWIAKIGLASAPTVSLSTYN
jgi:hypothetical protein